MSEIVRKVCICGDPSVGKTSLVKRFVTGKYDDKYISTLGTMISKKSIKNQEPGKDVTMMLWDISGQREFHRIHAAAFKNATAGFAVCDVTKPDTIQHLSEWVNNFRDYAGQDVPVSVLVNKTDLAAQNKDTLKSIKISLDKLGLPVYMTSAKTGDNVEKAFSDMARQILKTGRAVPEAEAPSPTTNGVPDQFDSTNMLLDYIMMRFCDALGDHEMAMHIIRKQMSNLQIEFQSMTVNQARVLSANLVPVIQDFKGEEHANNLKHELMKACDRCNR